jgi:4-hydroxy-2-oxoheptanedioate aldolase
MRSSRILSKLRRGEATFVTALHFNDPAVFELASLLGFDGIWLDMEHQARSMQTAAQLMRGARVGVSDVMCRIAKGEFLRMSRALEAGAQGIMYPRCDDAAEAREVVQWAKFAPLGTRGVDSAGADNPYLLTPLVEYLKTANEQTFVVIQIEDAAALDKAGEIAAVEGVDVLFFGPGDFSILSGFAGQWNDVRIEDAMKRIAEAARKAGKHWGMPCFTPEHAQKVYDLGGRFLAHGSDMGSLKNALEDIQKRFGPVGVKFERRA